MAVFCVGDGETYGCLIVKFLDEERHSIMELEG
jgi:hypothetical protein